MEFGEDLIHSASSSAVSTEVTGLIRARLDLEGQGM